MGNQVEISARTKLIPLHPHVNILLLLIITLKPMSIFSLMMCLLGEKKLAKTLKLKPKDQAK